MPPNGTSAQATDDMVNGMHSPPSDSTQETCQSPDKKSPRALSKLDKAREKNEELQGRQVQLLREKTKWKDRKKRFEDILDKMIHSRVCIDQTCSIITKTNDLSAELDNDIFSVLSGGHSRDQTVKQVSQAIQICCVDNNKVKGKVQDNLVPEQILPKQITHTCDYNYFDPAFVNPICFNDSPVYDAISPDGRIDHDISDASDDSGKSTVSGISKHSPNGFFSSTQQEQHHENTPISETHVINNNTKEENNYLSLAELDSAHKRTKRTVGNLISFLQQISKDKPVEDNCQSSCKAETFLNSNTKPLLPTSNTKPSLKRQSCSYESRLTKRRVAVHQACIIKHKSADNTDDKESVLVAEAENTNKSESSIEVSPERQKLHVPELDKEGPPADNDTNANTFTKEDKEKGENGKKLDSTPEKPQTEMGRSTKECQSNMSILEIDSYALNKANEVATISDPAEADRSNKIEHTETCKQQVGGHNIDAALNTVAVSTVLGEETPVLDNKVKVDTVNKKCDVITDKMKEQLTATENNANGAVLQIVEYPKATPKALGSDATEPLMVNEGIKKKDVLTVQNTDTVTFIDEKSHIKVLQVTENGVADLPTEDTAKVPIEPDKAHGVVDYSTMGVDAILNVCSLKEHGLKPNTIKRRESLNTTCSAIKALPAAVAHTEENRAQVDTNNEKDCTSCIAETTMMMNSELPSRRMTGLNTTGYCEEKGIAIGETVTMEKNVAIDFVVLDHPNKLRDSDKEEKSEVVQCDDHKSNCNTRKRLPKTVNNVEAHLKTRDNDATEETCREVNNSEGGAGKMVGIYIKKASVDAGHSTLQQNKATVDHAGTRIHRAIYSTEWGGHLFCFYIYLAMSLFIGLLALVLYTNV